jgi:hypothetical protein
MAIAHFDILGSFVHCCESLVDLPPEQTVRQNSLSQAFANAAGRNTILSWMLCQEAPLVSAVSDGTTVDLRHQMAEWV